MEEWKEYKLGDCVEAVIDNRGKSAPTKPLGEFPLLEINSIGGYYPNYSVIRKYVDKVTYYTWFRSGHPICGDILIPTVGTIGIISIMDNHKACIAQNLIALRTKKEISNIFIYYFLKSPIVKKQLINLDIGGVQPSIKVPHLLNLSISLPEKDIQHKIASILSSLDDKIEVNRRINENLEQQAQALFRSWFVDFEPFRDQPFVESELGMIPEGWRVGTLFDVAEIFDKQRKPLSGKEREGMKRLYPYYGATSCMDYVDNYLFDGIYTLIGEDGSVAKEDGSPYMQYVWGKFWVNNHAHILQGKNGFSTEMIYVLLSITNIQHLVTGAVQAKLSQANMQKIVLAIPPTNVLNQVRPVIDSMYETRRGRENESRRLAELRDTLLPRLMSGELKVNEIKA